MIRRGPRLGFLAGLLIALFPSGVLADQPLDAIVGATATGKAMGPGFVGLSLEYRALHVYTGRDPQAIDPVLVQLIRGLNPGHSPILRIGGDSSDATWWPIPGVVPPGGINYALTPGWLRMTRALAAELNAHLIMGVNLAGGRPALAAAEGRAFIQGIGRRYLEAFEIGNEPDVYNVFPWYRDRDGRVFFARNRNWNMNAFTTEFSRWRAVLPAVPTAGPAFAELTWLSGLGRFLRTETGLRVVTIHRYPLHGCITDTTSPSYPSIANLLADTASSTLAANVAHYVTTAHDQGVRFRIDEINSAAVASCLGRPGVSDTFASALWALDTLFNLASVGVDGVNLHTLPRAAYELFTFNQRGGVWHAFVHPEYYGLLMFGQAFPPGARLLPVTVPTGPVKVWATAGPGHTLRVEAINKDPSAAHTVRVKLPRSSVSATLEYLQAPSAGSTSHVTLGGQTFGTDTNTGQFPAAPAATPVLPELGTYTINLPPASAALLTQH